MPSLIGRSNKISYNNGTVNNREAHISPFTFKSVKESLCANNSTAVGVFVSFFSPSTFVGVRTGQPSLRSCRRTTARPCPCAVKSSFPKTNYIYKHIFKHQSYRIKYHIVLYVHINTYMCAIYCRPIFSTSGGIAFALTTCNRIDFRLTSFLQRNASLFRYYIRGHGRSAARRSSARVLRAAHAADSFKHVSALVGAVQPCPRSSAVSPAGCCNVRACGPHVSTKDATEEPLTYSRFRL